MHLSGISETNKNLQKNEDALFEIYVCLNQKVSKNVFNM